MKIYQSKTQIGLLLAIFLFSLLCQGQNAMAQEIPNGDGDLLWERSIYPRFVNDAKFHPINGNIIAAVNHEIWEIDPKNGNTIRVLYAGTSSEEKYHFHSIDITSNGSAILTDDGDSILVWDYEKGVVKQTFHNGETIAWQGLGGIYPDNKRVVYFSYNTEQQVRKLNIYDISTNSIIKSISTYPKSADKVKLSKDGRYLAIGFRYRPVNDMIYTMELWDAETLTKIRDFGSPGDIIEFRDVQISDDNQYVGFLTGGDSKLYLFDILKNHNEIYEGALTLTFSKDSKYFFIQQDTSWNNVVSYIVDIANYLPRYEYKKFSPYNYQFNKNNELVGGREKLLYFSNNWHLVGVKENTNEVLKITYLNSILSLLLPPSIIPNKIVVSDTLGNKYLEENLNYNESNEYSLNILLTTKTYFLTITTSTGQEIIQKFIVIK